MKGWEATRVLQDYMRGDLDPVDHVMMVYDNIRKWEPRVNAFIEIAGEDVVYEYAYNAREQYKKGEPGPLEGLLVAVKDNISTSFTVTTAASRMLDGYTPPFDATVVSRLCSAGAIIHGKTNLDEFAMGSTTENSAFFPTRNPWSLERVPGGSSGGSAAALAYGGADLALGSDTGGSVRLPAAYTATVGLKPTYGHVSRYGLIPYANSLEQISPMARSVRDVALLYSLISGGDPLDATSLKRIRGVDPWSLKPAEPEAVRVCIDYKLLEGAESVISNEVLRVAGWLEAQGASVEEVELKYSRHALPVYYTLAFAEASSNLARYDGILYPFKGEGGGWEDAVLDARSRGFGLEVKRRIIMGVYVLSEGYRDEYYIAATKARRLIRDEILNVTRRCVLLTPVSPVLPPRLGERIRDPLKLYLMDIYTITANLAGVPALVQPSGIIDGLPVGIQWMGYRGGEEELFRIGLLVEEYTGLAGVIAG